MTDVAQSGVGVVTPLHDGCCSVTHSQLRSTQHTAHSTQHTAIWVWECRASPHVCPVRFQPVVPRKNEIVLYISSSIHPLCAQFAVCTCWNSADGKLPANAATINYSIALPSRVVWTVSGTARKTSRGWVQVNFAVDLKNQLFVEQRKLSQTRDFQYELLNEKYI